MTIKGVQFVSVVGVPDPVAIDLPAAVIVKLPGYEDLTEQQIKDAVAAKFPAFKHLHGGAYFVDKIPATPTGKFKKRLVREIATKFYLEAKTD